MKTKKIIIALIILFLFTSAACQKSASSPKLVSFSKEIEAIMKEEIDFIAGYTSQSFGYDNHSETIMVVTVVLTKIADESICKDIISLFAEKVLKKNNYSSIIMNYFTIEVDIYSRDHSIYHFYTDRSYNYEMWFTDHNTSIFLPICSDEIGSVTIREGEPIEAIFKNSDCFYGPIIPLKKVLNQCGIGFKEDKNVLMIERNDGDTLVIDLDVQKCQILQPGESYDHRYHLPLIDFEFDNHIDFPKAVYHYSKIEDGEIMVGYGIVCSIAEFYFGVNNVEIKIDQNNNSFSCSIVSDNA